MRGWGEGFVWIGGFRCNGYSADIEDAGVEVYEKRFMRRG